MTPVRVCERCFFGLAEQEQRQKLNPNQQLKHQVSAMERVIEALMLENTQLRALVENMETIEKANRKTIETLWEKDLSNEHYISQLRVSGVRAGTQCVFDCGDVDAFLETMHALTMRHISRPRSTRRSNCTSSAKASSTSTSQWICSPPCGLSSPLLRSSTRARPHSGSMMMMTQSQGLQIRTTSTIWAGITTDPPPGRQQSCLGP